MTRPVITSREFNRKAELFRSIHAGQDTGGFIRNVGATVEMLEAGDLLLPCTRSRPDARDAWICSPITTYCDYAHEELQRLGKPLLSSSLGPLIAAVRAGMTYGQLDHCVFVNNWLLSTNSYPDADVQQVHTVLAAARQRWPDRAIWFRSLNQVHTPSWLQELHRAGAIMIPSRQVYLYAHMADLYRRHSDLKKDFSWLRRNQVKTLLPTSLTDGDYVDIATLYAKLYMQKYSSLNPHYTQDFVRSWHRAGLLDLRGQRDADGRLKAVVGMVRMGELITSPLVGYDTSSSKHEGLYRLLAATVLHEGLSPGMQINLSAGVAHFKRQRGGNAAVEYSAVLADHLPAKARSILRCLSLVSSRIGVPIMRHFKL